MTTYLTNSGHTMFQNTSPTVPPELQASADNYEKFESFHNSYRLASGTVFFWVGRGYKGGTLAKHKKQVHVFYRNGQMWSGFGNTILEALNGAQKDGWLYAK